MKHLRLLLVAIAFCLTSCTTTQSLYYWGGTSGDATKYEALAYKNYDAQSPESICELVCLYEDMVTHPGGTRKVVPPGICAEYGYLLLQPSTVEAFDKHATKKQRKMMASVDFAQRGAEMLRKEMELYPESVKFIEPLLKRLQK